MWLPAPCEWLDPPLDEAESLLLSEDDEDDDESEDDELDESESDESLELLEELPLALLPGLDPEP